MIRYKIQKEVLFVKLDKDGNGFISKDEFRTFFLENNLIEGVTR